MPELPEVEIIRSQLDQAVLKLGPVVSVELPSLSSLAQTSKQYVPKDFVTQLPGLRFLKIDRRGKYLLWHTHEQVLINHLGMTGCWTVNSVLPHPTTRHLHCKITFDCGTRLIYHDPRRFGYFGWARRTELASHPRLLALGPDPFSDQLSPEYLRKITRQRKVPIKSFIMNQKIISGLGNIYASEILFEAKIAPTKAAHSLTQQQCHCLVLAIQKVLTAAIGSGGSTISDYRNASGQKGGYQNYFKVYGRLQSPCFVCKGPIRMSRLGQRSTFWCPKCQTS